MKNNFFNQNNRINILVFILLFVYCPGKAQTIFTKQDTLSNFFGAVYEDSLQNYFVINGNTYPKAGYAAQGAISKVYKISSMGVLLNTYNLPQNFTTASLIYRQNSFYVLGFKVKFYQGNQAAYFPTINKYDYNFNLLNTCVLDSVADNNIIAFHTSKPVFLNNNIYLGYCNYSASSIKLYKLGINLSKKDSSNFTGSIISDMEILGNKILLAGWQFAQPSVYGNNQVATLDSSFNVLNRFNLDSLTTVNIGCSEKVGIFMKSNLHSVNDSMYIISGHSTVIHNSNCDEDFQNIVSLIKHTGNKVINTNIIGKPNVDDIIFERETETSARYNFVYNAIASDINTGTPQIPQTHTTQILINKVDNSNTLIWTKYFDDPNMFYAPMAIFATKDSGAVITGLRYNFINPQISNVGEGFVMKINKNGTQVFVGIHEIAGNFITAKCYPNPVKDQIFFDMPFNDLYSVSIFDAMGKRLFFNKGYQNQNAINVSELPTGIYFYKVESHGKIHNGKFVKNE